ncbi:heavy-metal-associated domain-containing protein [Flavobacterium luteum]|uniref:Heavy-metal-associated domain-containing protein n=1 Tax=Flavobacterium luteum TaxID=2026654 RepID=A0A7J5AET3_9FLAO|nr:heavy metal-associated domain-containing protein [Flavobacterium luteum]KAB1156094.1 heavy-metal-associated domain-containing protein [Flavobacterium luteum]
MNFTKSIFALCLSIVLFTSCKQTNSEPKEEATEKNATPVAKLETASFNIEGMTCAIGCAKTIEKELSETEGVQKATVDFDNKLATVSFDATKQTAETLVKVVEATADGKTYKVSNVKSSGNKAMLLVQEPEKKEDQKKSCSADSKKAIKGKGCCAKKKHCEKEEKKATTM